MKKGFTLVEMLIVLAISAPGIALSYNSASRKEIALSVEAAKISQFILQAESLSIATYGANSATLVCGYGMVFNAAAQTYGIFEYQPAGATTCTGVALPLASIAAGEMQQYTPGTWNIHVAPEVRLVSASTDSIAVVLFLSAGADDLHQPRRKQFPFPDRDLKNLPHDGGRQRCEDDQREFGGAGEFLNLKGIGYGV